MQCLCLRSYSAVSGTSDGGLLVDGCRSGKFTPYNSDGTLNYLPGFDSCSAQWLVHVPSGLTCFICSAHAVCCVCVSQHTAIILYSVYWSVRTLSVPAYGVFVPVDENNF